ncbi:alpha/beta hydrolase-fold protein [Chitinophaga sp. Cy-1792]|uniref:alpha/beta hydrolase-fold protein n=1 Tax=Chitinophaga sp. Cy-1792 TaxID=2608339 RepID=UPI001421363A|nr:alpha/beta hydrolase-fold protein [Chitinophaga sp. Cy-1792]NIG55960.1 EamA family transporter [Chitinophaga sp. Cy-1792]
MKKLKGIMLVTAGAASYGVLATYVKIAGQQGFSTAAITFAQYFTGCIVLFILDLFRKRSPVAVNNIKENLRLLGAGTFLGLTSTFYYLAVQYLPVSVTIVLLMQTIWMGILVDCIRNRSVPTIQQVAAIVIVLAGTFLATGIMGSSISWNGKGAIYGLLSAVCYTGAMYAANHVATGYPLFYRSKMLVAGGLIAILLFWNRQLVQDFEWAVIPRWGLFLGLFGTILPPVLFSKGFPIVGMGLGSVLAAIEIPVSAGLAHVVLQEAITTLQIVGCILIIAGIVLQNFRFSKRLKQIAVPVILLFTVTSAKAAMVDTLKVYSPSMKKGITTLVVRPDATATQPLPSVYVLHGYSGNPTRTLTLDIPSLPALADLYQLVFVLPDGGFDKWYLNSPLMADVQYETFLSKELPAYIDSSYHTRTDRFGRAIMGWSMGGYGALHTGMHYSHMFGAIGSICGAVEIVPFIKDFGINKLIGNDSASWKQYDVLQNARQLAFSQQEIILTCGTDDPFLPYNRELNATLNKLHIAHTYVESPGAHDFRYWSDAAQYEVLFLHNYFERYKYVLRR